MLYLIKGGKMEKNEASELSSNRFSDEFEPSKAEVVENPNPENKLNDKTENKPPLEKKEPKSGKQDEPEKKKLEDLLKSKPISYLNNVPLRITAELSRARITMRNLLEYKKGSVIQLEKLAGEPMDILINDEYVAKGEVVVVNDKYAVRLTDLIEKMEMLNREYNEEIS